MFIGRVCAKLWKHVEVCSHLAGVLRNRTWYNVIIENVRIQMWLKPRFSPYQLGEGHVRNGYNPAWPTGKMAHLENCDIQPDMPHFPWIFWEKCHPAWKKKNITPIKFPCCQSSSWPRIEHPPGLRISGSIGSDFEVPKFGCEDGSTKSTKSYEIGINM